MILNNIYVILFHTCSKAIKYTKKKEQTKIHNYINQFQTSTYIIYKSTNENVILLFFFFIGSKRHFVNVFISTRQWY